MSLITEDAAKKIADFNSIGLHYNLVADAVYRLRAQLSDPFDPSYQPYIIAALTSFDMGRMMGVSRYDKGKGTFATALEAKLKAVRPHVSHLCHIRLDELSVDSERRRIQETYAVLAASGEGSLNQRRGTFHVGASKIMHFLNPQAFIIVDSNAQLAFQAASGIPRAFSSERYLERLACAQRDVLEFGVDRFCALDAGVPLTRIYDKLTFMSGAALKERAATRRQVT
jgi:hypothetical protein